MTDSQIQLAGGQPCQGQVFFDATALPVTEQKLFRQQLELLETKNKLLVRLIICWFLVAGEFLATLTLLALLILRACGHAVPDSILLGLAGPTVGGYIPLLRVFVRSVWRK